MTTQETGPFGPPSRETGTRTTQFPAAVDFETDQANPPIHLNQPTMREPNDAYVLPNSVYDKSQWESDAQIAARKAMAKRSSRSFAARTSRIRSRREKFGRQAKFGIKVDTSVSRHRGNVPRQVYPSDNDHPTLKASGTIRKANWWSLGRSSTKSIKGLGITGGPSGQTPRLAGDALNELGPKITTYRANNSAMQGYNDPSTNFSNRETLQSNKDLRTADSLTPGAKSWMEISPSDRPIPIGISVPTESLSDFSPYDSTRKRSESDATLVTPSIVVTPAVMKSVWSPDTESDYTPGRSSSIYSMATFHLQPTCPNIPPVPALPSTIPTRSGTLGLEAENGVPASHIRKTTLDSAVTAFEEDNEVKRRDRIASGDTVFEEDDTPSAHTWYRQALSALSLDTGVTPTPRRSRGWWNVITTPFELSRNNSLWTNHGIPNGDRTPDVPMVPPRFDAGSNTPTTPSTYIWSATDKSLSTLGDSPVIPISLQHAPAKVTNVESGEEPKTTERVIDSYARSVPGKVDFQGEPQIHDVPAHGVNQVPAVNERDLTSPLSGVTASPVLRTAAIGTVVMPDRPHQINVSIELKDSRKDGSHHVVYMPSQSATNSHSPSPAVTRSETPDRYNNQHEPAPRFDPPPIAAQSFTQNRTPDAQSLGGSSTSTSPKHPKKHRKVYDKSSVMDWIKKKMQISPKQSPRDRKKRRSRRCCCLWACCCIILLCLIAIIVPVVVVLSRRHGTEPKDKPEPGQGSPLQEGPEGSYRWLNLTGYPPVPTGISTIAQPEAVEEETGCVVPATAWSCAIPKEDQSPTIPNKPNQPNFRIEIVFENGTVADPSKTRPVRRAANAVSAGALIRSGSLNSRAAPSPFPVPPSIDDQKFLGDTTDQNVTPFEGEETPFFISFLPSTKSTSRLRKRLDIGDIADIIPKPSVNSDGTAAAANLFPLPSSQPLRLYNRGKDTEHYGFYVYFDRSIFLKSIDGTNSTFGGIPADKDGGSPFDAASLRCTWSQTRFLVQIWTRGDSTKPLLQGRKSQSSSSPADDLNRPGSFPYPVTVTIDRHGGSNKDKMIYCYELDQSGRPLTKKENKKFLLEDRAFGGVPVNPTNGPLEDTNSPFTDGGSGGCKCQWQNWLG